MSGRPVGTEETPERLMRAELIAQLKLYRQLRELIQKRIKESGETMKPEELAQYMDLLRKGITDTAKGIIAPAKSETAKPAEAEEDPQEVLDRLINGEKK